MKYSIITLLLILPLSFFAQQSDTKLLPVLMLSDDGRTKLEISYNEKNSITRIMHTAISPFDSTTAYVSTTTFSYKGASVINVNNIKKMKEVTTDSLFYSLILKDDTIEVRTKDKNLKMEVVTDNYRRLTSVKYYRPLDSNRSIQQFMYDKAGNLSEYSTDIDSKKTDTSFSMNQTYLYPDYTNKKGVLSAVNNPEWLLCYYFNIIYGFLNHATETHYSSVFDGEVEKPQDYKIEYEYDESGYPIVIELIGSDMSPLRISYKEANR